MKTPRPSPSRQTLTGLASHRKLSGYGAPPHPGQTISVRGQACRVTRVHAAGTLDCVTLDGTRAFRVTGLQFR